MAVREPVGSASDYLRSLGTPHAVVDKVCGMDEVGRGSFAGPFVAAAVILPLGFSHPLVRDSKQLSPRQRALADTIVREAALAIAITEIGVDEINAHGIGKANIAAFRQLARDVKADLYLSDGTLPLPARDQDPAIESIPKGDQLVAAIAAASIIAKVYRDTLMEALATTYPSYEWERNKGYGSPTHQAALRRLGPTPHHRTAFIASTLASVTSHEPVE